MIRRIGLLGNPNCGKTTLFNQLTGHRRKVGNWSGVTVAEGAVQVTFAEQTVELIDLPGVYSLHATSDSADEAITQKSLYSGQLDAIINVIDVRHLERQLFLTAQLVEFGLPMVVVLNMQDMAQQCGVSVKPEQLARQLGCPVVCTVADKGEGVSPLAALLPQSWPTPTWRIPYAEAIETALADGGQKPRQVSRAGFLFNSLNGEQPRWAKQVTAETGERLDTLIDDARYTAVHTLCAVVSKTQSRTNETITERIDRVVLHRIWGLPLFLFMLYLTFLIGINFGSLFQEFFSLTSQALAIDLPAQVLASLHAPELLRIFVVGIGMGVHTTVTFIPVLFMLFVMLSLLERTGYMARAAIIMDRFMANVGLSGKAFLPLILGFGCNVPAIMATRTLEQPRERVTTILMAPFMSCSARLAVFSVFVTAFFPHHGALIIFSLYIIGILCAIVTGLWVSLWWPLPAATPLVFELPAYHRPHLLQMAQAAWSRLTGFLWRAGKIIVPVCLVLSVMNLLPWSTGQDTWLSVLGQWMTPLFYPMGLSADNWPATVGLITGSLAKEVLIGSLNTLYSQLGSAPATPLSTDVLSTLGQAIWSIPNNVLELVQGFINPIGVLVTPQAFGHTAYGEFVTRFGSSQAAYAYLLFVLLYMPCVSTFAVTVQELNWRYAYLSLAWSMGMAYVVAVGFYQMATFAQHPWQSGICMFAFVLMVLYLVVRVGRQQQREGVI